jgi:hypothetical protein
MADENKVESHPSYGLLQISRATGGRGALFGSSVKHQHFIMLRIHRGEARRDLNHTWYADVGQELIEVAMSPAQFAEAITSMNMGLGVPCTIQYLGGERQPEPPFTSVRAQFKEEFEQEMKDLYKKVLDNTKDLEEILAKKSLTKGDRDRIRCMLGLVYRKLKDSVPFIHSQFDEAMEKTVTEAKAEVEAYALHAALVQGQAVDGPPTRLLELADIDAGKMGNSEKS